MYNQFIHAIFEYPISPIRTSLQVTNCYEFIFPILCMIIRLLHIVIFTAKQKETIILELGTTAVQRDI